MAALFILLSGVSVAAARPVNRAPAGNGTKRIALTFDDGPHPRYTPVILDILKEYGIHATFFVIGQNADLYPAPLKRAVREGHEIGNHTYSHPHMKRISAQEARVEIDKCQKKIQELTGKTPTLFRPPEGFCTNEESEVLEELHLTGILWTIDTHDWAGNDSNNICATVNRLAGDGKIILFHDYISHKNTTITALRQLIPSLLREGYEFCTVSELFSPA